MTAQPSPKPNNRQRGASFEEQIEWGNNILQANGRAFIYRNGTQGKIAKGRAILVRSRPDFEGVLTTLGGRHVAFDAKLTASMRYAHPTDRLHQLEDLWRVQDAGGIGFLLVSFNMERYFIVWPADEWKDRKFASIRLDQMASWEGVEVPVAGGYSLPDWLSTLERLYQK